MLELISETNYRETMENTVEPKLASIREELSLPLEDGGALHAELYEQPTATRAVVVLHGYTESGEKFREMTWYFLQSICRGNKKSEKKAIKETVKPTNLTFLK